MAALRTYHAIKFIGLETREMAPKMKAHMFKCYVRPIIYYGLENIYLFKTEKRKIQLLESNIVKKMLGVKKRTKSTNLLYSVGVEQVEEKVKILKLRFANRILSNNLTSQILNHTLINDKKNKFVSEIKEIIGNNNDQIDTDLMKDKIKLIQKKTGEMKASGISDSILFCLNNRSENENNLKLLIRAF